MRALLCALTVILPLAAVAGEATEDLPPEIAAMAPGEGREATYYACAACHSIRLVTQQGLSRERWEKLFVWMVEEQNMPPLDPTEEALILDYLGQYYGAKQQGPRRAVRR